MAIPYYCRAPPPASPLIPPRPFFAEQKQNVCTLLHHTYESISINYYTIFIFRTLFINHRLIMCVQTTPCTAVHILLKEA